MSVEESKALKDKLQAEVKGPRQVVLHCCWPLHGFPLLLALVLKDYRSFPRALAGMIPARKVISLITGVIGSQPIWLISDLLITPP